MKLLLLFGSFLLTIDSFAQLRWEKLQLPQGHISSTLTTSPLGSLFLRTKDTIFRSNDEGNTWQSVFIKQWGTLVVDSSGNLYDFYGSKVNFSSDNGSSWKERSFPYEYPQFFCAATLVILTHGMPYPQVFISKDRGINWIKRTYATNTYDLGWARGYASPSGNVFGGAQYDGAVWLVFPGDGKRLWTDYSDPPVIDNNPISWMVFTDDGYGYASHGTTILSSDEGLTWLPMDSIYGPIFRLNDHYGMYATIRHSILDVEEDSTWISYDHGATWEHAGDGLPNDYHIRWFVTSRNGTCYAQTDSGIFYTTVYASIMIEDHPVNKPYYDNELDAICLGGNTPGEVRLYDINGREVAGASMKSPPISTSTLNTGLYFLRIQAKETVSVSKIAIIK